MDGVGWQLWHLLRVLTLHSWEYIVYYPLCINAQCTHLIYSVVLILFQKFTTRIFRVAIERVFQLSVPLNIIIERFFFIFWGKKVSVFLIICHSWVPICTAELRKLIRYEINLGEAEKCFFFFAIANFGTNNVHSAPKLT